MGSPHAPLGLHITLDCREPVRLAAFWAEALNYRAGPVGDPYTTLHPKGPGPDLTLQQVSEPRSGKNRMHLDLRVESLHDEISRLQALGATVTEVREEPGWHWAVMADPEGNEFCVMQPTPA